MTRITFFYQKRIQKGVNFLTETALIHIVPSVSFSSLAVLQFLLQISSSRQVPERALVGLTIWPRSLRNSCHS